MYTKVVAYMQDLRRLRHYQRQTAFASNRRIEKVADCAYIAAGPSARLRRYKRRMNMPQEWCANIGDCMQAAFLIKSLLWFISISQKVTAFEVWQCSVEITDNKRALLG